MASELPQVPFARLWANFPDDQPCVNAQGKVPPGWSNQCAVRLSAALSASGVSLSSFKGATCPTKPGQHLAASAQALANWLRERKRMQNMSPLEQVAPKSWEARVASRTGIVFFKDYWRRSGETNGAGTGDHIDLWNRDTLTGGFVSFLRFRLGIGSIPNPFGSDDDPNFYSDLSGSSQVWFWAVA